VEQDDTLILLFMCCHETLTSSSAIALTLRAVGGLTTAEIARAYFVPRRRWPADQPGEEHDQSVGDSISSARRAVSRRRTFGRCCTSCIDLQRGYTSSDGAHCSEAIWRAKRSG
jgi:hypothetical protein